MPQFLDQPYPPGFPALLPGLFHPAKVAQRRVMCLLRSDAAPKALLDLPLKVVTQLRVQLTVHGASES